MTCHTMSECFTMELHLAIILMKLHLCVFVMGLTGVVMKCGVLFVFCGAVFLSGCCVAVSVGVFLKIISVSPQILFPFQPCLAFLGSSTLNTRIFSSYRM